MVNKEKIDFTIEDILRIEQEYILSLEGYSIKEIAELTERDYSTVYYDLVVLLEYIDNKKSELLNCFENEKVKSKKI